MDETNREMETLKVAYDILEEGAKTPVSYIKSFGHLVFDARMTLEQKYRWVKDGHRNPKPEWSTSAGVVSRECSHFINTCCSKRPTYLLMWHV